MATGTWGSVAAAADNRVFTLHMMDASGDLWTEQLWTAIAATYAAVQAWVILYQAVTQTTIYGVTEENSWMGDADPDNADAEKRMGGETGINLLFKDPNTRITRPIRVIAPEPDTMQGNQDIPLLTSDGLSDLIVATLGLNAAYPFASAQYTVHRERKGNPKVK